MTKNNSHGVLMNKYPRTASCLIPSIGQFIFIAIFLVLSAYQGDKLLGDGDTGYHIRLGEYILDNLTIPKLDLYRFFLPPSPQVPHAWLSEVLMAIAYRLAGLTGVVFFYAILLALVHYAFFKSIGGISQNITLQLFFTVIVLISTRVHWLARPHVFTLLFFVYFCFMLSSMQNGARLPMYALPLAMIFWVNLHGGYVVGFIILGLYILGNAWISVSSKSSDSIHAVSRTKYFARIFILCLIGALINPAGHKILFIPFNLLADSYMTDVIAEYMSPNFHEFVPFKYLLLGVILIFGFSEKKPTKVDILIVLFFANMALNSIRHIPLFAIVTAPIMMQHTETLLQNAPSRIRTYLATRTKNIAEINALSKGFIWPLLIVILVTYLISSQYVVWSFDQDKKPIAAIEFLKHEQIYGNMFNNDEYGDFVIYFAHNNYKVFYDGRLDMDGPKRLKEYAKVANIESGWEDIINKYSISWIFFDTNSVLTRTLIKDNSWKLIYSDKVASIFVKDILLHKHLIKKFPDVKLATVT